MSMIGKDGARAMANASPKGGDSVQNLEYANLYVADRAFQDVKDEVTEFVRRNTSN